MPPSLLLFELPHWQGSLPSNQYSRGSIGTHKPHLQPVIPIPAIVAQQLGRVAVIRGRDVEVAVVVIIPEGRSSAHARNREIGP
jgi:hypothetical protein